MGGLSKALGCDSTNIKEEDFTELFGKEPQKNANKDRGFPRVEDHVKVIVYDAFPALFVLGGLLLEEAGLLYPFLRRGSKIHKVYGGESLIIGEDGRITTNYSASGIKKQETALLLSALFKAAMWRGVEPET